MVLGLLADNPPASDLFHDPLFLTIIASVIAIIAAVLGSVITNWYTGRQDRKKVIYNIISDTPILSMEKEIGGQVEVLFNNKVFKHLRLILAEVWNSGQRPIPPGEFIEPITFSLTEPAEVLDTEIVEKKPDSLQASLQRTSNSVILEPLLLNKNNKVRLKILVSGTGELKVAAGIVGVEIANYSKIAMGRSRLFRMVSSALTMLGLICWITLGILVLLFMPPTQNSLYLDVLLLVWGILFIMLSVFISIIADRTKTRS